MDDFLGKVIIEIINPLILFLFALAVVFFLWGMLQFLIKQDDEEARTTGKSHMLWSIVGIAIMMGVWTILNIVLSTLNIDYVEVDDGKIEVKMEPVQ